MEQNTNNLTGGWSKTISNFSDMDDSVRVNIRYNSDSTIIINVLRMHANTTTSQ